MTDLRAFLSKLHQNLNILQEREAKYGGNVPLELLNQISDHQEAIALTEQAIRGSLSQAEWEESLRPLLVAVAPEQAAHQIVLILGEYAPDQGASLSRSLGREAAAAAGELVNTTLTRLRQDPKTAVIVEEFEQEPGAAQALLQKKLAEAILADPAFAAGLKTLLARWGQAGHKSAPAAGPTYRATLTGSGAIAQGPGAQAAGAGGVIVGGSVGGSIVTGGQQRTINTGGGVYVEGSANTGGGDFVGRDQISGVTGANLAQLFRQIYRQIEARPVDPKVDRAEITETVQKIEQEVKKGEAANESKVERWLKTLKEMAPDIGDVTVACLTNPAAGVAMVIKKIAEAHVKNKCNPIQPSPGNEFPGYQTTPGKPG